MLSQRTPATLNTMPPEILDNILGQALNDHGIRDLTLQRTVCKAFDVHIETAIFNLPTFEHFEDESPFHLQRDPEMSKDFIAKYILSKLRRADALKRPLTAEIQKTIEHVKLRLQQAGIEAVDDNDISRKYAESLAKLAADYLPLQIIVANLELKTIQNITEESKVSANAYVAALNMLDGKHMSILEFGVNKWQYTRFFGHALSIAARAGDGVVFCEIYESTPLDVPPWHVSVSKMQSLVEAATVGHDDIAKSMAESRKICHGHPEYAEAICAAMRGCHEALAVWLLHHRNNDHSHEECPANRRAQYPFHSSFVTSSLEETVLVVASETNCAEVVRTILDRGRPMDQSIIDTALEDAASRGHAEIVHMLLQQFDKTLFGAFDRSTSHSLYWAARNDHLDILQTLMKRTGADTADLWDALAGAFYASRQDALIHLIDAITNYQCRMSTWYPRLCEATLEIEKFGTLVQLLAVHLPWARRIKCESENDSSSDDDSNPRQGDPDSCEERALTACEDGNLYELDAILNSHCTNVATNRITENCARKALSINGRPSILLYLFEIISLQSVQTDCMGYKDTAACQVLLDCGNTVHMLPVDFTCLTAPYDERVGRWLLARGMDVNLHVWEEGDHYVTLLDAVLGNIGSLSFIRFLLQKGALLNSEIGLQRTLHRDPHDCIEIVDLLARLSIQHLNTPNDFARRVDEVLGKLLRDDVRVLNVNDEGF